MKLLFIAIACAAGCDVPPDPPKTEAVQIDHLDEVQFVETALQALESDEVYQPEFWSKGLKSGSVDLGGWVCLPPSGPIRYPKEE